MEPLSRLSRVDFLIRYAWRFPRCGSVIASRAPLLIQRLTVVSSTRRRRATSRTVKRSFLLSSTIAFSPAPFRCSCASVLLLRGILSPLFGGINDLEASSSEPSEDVVHCQ